MRCQCYLTDHIWKKIFHADAKFRDFLDKLDQSSSLLGNASVLVNCFSFLQYFPGDPLKMKLLKEHSEIIKRWCETIIQEHMNTYQNGTARDFIDLYIVG